MDVAFSAAGSTAERELRSLQEWLRSEGELRGSRVFFAEPERRPGEMGGIADVLIVALGGGGAGVVLARSLETWLRQRTSSALIKIRRGDREAEIDLRSMRDATEMSRVLGAVKDLLDVGEDR